MVHALDKSRSFLHSQGILLNVHDLPRPHCIEIHSGGGNSFTGYLLSYIDFMERRLADEALLQVVEQRHFASKEQHLFNYFVCADTLSELQVLLSESWDDSYLPAGTEKRNRDLLSAADGEAKIVLDMMARLTILSTADVVA